MSTSKYIGKIGAIIIALMLAVTGTLVYFSSSYAGNTGTTMKYESTLFDTSTVHTIDIVIDDFDALIESATSEEYQLCTVVIDGKACKNVAIRVKGNTSLTNVASYGNDRYSFKIEFDHYDDTNTYYGLDKLCLNNVIQDNTYMKDYLTYTLMSEFGVDSPFASFAYITINGEDFGLYLAVEAVEDSFEERNYSDTTGNLYKPDSQTMGGGKGEGGKDFDMDKANQSGMSKSDVSLIYTDDDYDSYSNIFDSAKQDITDEDKDNLIAALKSINENTDIESAVDVEEVIRYFVVHNFVCNFDSYTGSMIHNYYLYENDGQLSMIPWDYNLAFGGFVGGSDATSLINYPIDSPVSGGDISSRPMIAWIFENEEYLEMYHEYFNEFIEQFYESGRLEEIIDEAYALIASYVENDPTSFCTYDEFTEGVDNLKKFCALRCESIRGQLNGSIASTSEGQKEDDESLIDGSAVSISAMGSMGNGGGPGGFPGGGDSDDNSGGFPGGGPNGGDSDDSGNPPTPPSGFNDNNEDNSGDSDDSNRPTPPDGNFGGFPGRNGENGGFGGSSASGNAEFTMPDRDNTESEDAEVSDAVKNYIMLGGSAAVLLGGMLVAAFYKRK